MIELGNRWKVWLPLCAAVAACSDYWGSGPDPSRGGPASSDLEGSGAQSAGGETGSCELAPLALLLDQVNADCADVRACARDNCDAELGQCLGPDYRRGDVSGPCMSHVSCASSCNCNESCLEGCNTSPNEACSTCLGNFSACLQSACATSFIACQGASDRPTVLSANLSNGVSALAVDADTLYFTTNSGLASIPKTGGAATALGGFSNLNGLAVGGGFIYVVVDNGAVVRVKKNGSESTPLIGAGVGGGSGPILLDGAQLFYVVGPYVRRGPAAGGAPSDLVNDVWQQGANAAQRLAFDASSVYYVGGGLMPGGGKSQLMVVKKDAAVIASGDPPGSHVGTSVATASGEIRGVVSDGTNIYFADLASDGLEMRLRIQKLEPSSGRVTPLASVMASQNTGGATPVATDGDAIFVAGSLGLLRISATDGSVTTLLPNARPSALVLDTEYVYWAEQSNGGVLKRMHKTLGSTR